MTWSSGYFSNNAGEKVIIINVQQLKHITRPKWLSLCPTGSMFRAVVLCIVLCGFAGWSDQECSKETSQARFYWGLSQHLPKVARGNWDVFIGLHVHMVRKDAGDKQLLHQLVSQTIHPSSCWIKRSPIHLNYSHKYTHYILSLPHTHRGREREREREAQTLYFNLYAAILIK